MTSDESGAFKDRPAGSSGLVIQTESCFAVLETNPPTPASVECVHLPSHPDSSAPHAFSMSRSQASKWAAYACRRLTSPSRLTEASGAMAFGLKGTSDHRRAVRRAIHEDVGTRLRSPDRKLRAVVGLEELDASLLLLPTVDLLPPTGRRVRSRHYAGDVVRAAGPHCSTQPSPPPSAGTLQCASAAARDPSPRHPCCPTRAGS